MDGVPRTAKPLRHPLGRSPPIEARLNLPPGQAGAVYLPPADRGRWPGARRHWHWHQELECNLVRCGSSTLLVGETLVTVAPRSLVFLPAGVAHGRLDFAHRLLATIAVWRIPFATAILGGSTLPGLVGCRVLDPVHFAALEALAAEVAQTQGPLADAGLGWLLSRLHLAWMQAGSVAAPGALHPAVAQAVALLDGAGPGADPSLAALARRVGLSPDWLTRRFRSEMGVLPGEYRNRLRLQRFLAGLRPGQNLEAAALAAGFGSYAQFHRVFTRLMGRNPRCWRAGD